MTATPLRVDWRPRAEPLPAAAVFAARDVVPTLALATAARLTAATSLIVVHSPGYLLVLGSADDLPWADGAVYLGREAGLLLPTSREPLPAAAFLAQALPAAPLRAVLPGLVLTATLPAHSPDRVQLADLR